jgi:hypothetical protein
VTNWLAQRFGERAARSASRSWKPVRVNRLVCRDAGDFGVLVVDRDGRVTQHNPQAQLLLDAKR